MDRPRNVSEQQSKRVLTWQDIERLSRDLTRQLVASNWRPEYIVGLVRGGTIPATMISHYYDVPMHALKISFRDDDTLESNTWMAEDAYNNMNILVVDDINDSGKTLKWLVEDWQNSCFPEDQPKWKKVWGYNVKFMSLVNNTVSAANVQFTGMSINKAQENVWIEFPWENWWK